MSCCDYSSSSSSFDCDCIGDKKHKKAKDKKAKDSKDLSLESTAPINSDHSEKEIIVKLKWSKYFHPTIVTKLLNKKYCLFGAIVGYYYVI